MKNIRKNSERRRRQWRAAAMNRLQNDGIVIVDTSRALELCDEMERRGHDLMDYRQERIGSTGLRSVWAA